MQDYAKLYPSRIRKSSCSGKLDQIRRLLLAELPPEIVVVLVAAVVLPSEMIAAIRR